MPALAECGLRCWCKSGLATNGFAAATLVHVGDDEGAAAFLNAFLRRGKADTGAGGGSDEDGFAGQEAVAGNVGGRCSHDVVLIEALETGH